MAKRNATALAQIERMKEKRNKLVTDSRAIIEKAEGEKREINAEEETTLSKMSADIEALDGRVTVLEGELFNDADEEDDASRNDDDKPDDDKRKVIVLPDGRRVVELGTGSERTKERMRTEKSGKRRRHESDGEYRDRMRRSQEEYREAAMTFLHEGVEGLRNRNMIGEKRAVQADLDIVGGFLVMPEQFVNQVLKAADNALFIRQLATVFKLANAQSIGVPTLDADPDDADWTSELATGNEDSAARFGKRELKPSPLAKRLKISNKLMKLSSVSGVLSVNDESSDGQGSGFERFLTGRLGYKLRVPQEKGFMTGNGVGQPLGVFTASSRGISTARDVTTTATAAINFDSLIEVKYSLKYPYQDKSEWLFNRAALRRIRQLKDQMGQYLWQPAVIAGQPDTILDRPVRNSEYCPSTFTTGSYVGMLACWEYYWIAEAETIQMQRLDELYAEKNQTGYIARCEIDGMPALEEAFSRIKLG